MLLKRLPGEKERKAKINQLVEELRVKLAKKGEILDLPEDWDKEEDEDDDVVITGEDPPTKKLKKDEPEKDPVPSSSKGKTDDPPKPSGSGGAVPTVGGVEGIVPESFPQLKGLGGTFFTDHTLMKDMKEQADLWAYLLANGSYDIINVQGDGNCQFISWLAQHAYWREFTHLHIRRQLVMWICANFEELEGEGFAAVSGNYGAAKIPPHIYAARQKVKKGPLKLSKQEILDQESLGPYSFGEYLRAMAGPGFWGDEFTLLCLSRMHMVKVSILKSKSLRPVHFQHEGPWWKADMVFLYVENQHYMPISKFLLIVRRNC